MLTRVFDFFGRAHGALQDFLDRPLASLGSTAALAVTAEVSDRAKSSLVADATGIFACLTAGLIAVFWAHKLFALAAGYYLRWRAGKRLLPIHVEDDDGGAP